MNPHLYIHIESEYEPATDRWIAEVTEQNQTDLDGVLVYGNTRDDAYTKIVTLALRVIAERVETGECPTQYLTIKFYDDAAIALEKRARR